MEANNVKNVQVKLGRNVVAPEGSDGQIVWVTVERARHLIDHGAATLLSKLPKVVEPEKIGPDETKPQENFEKKSLSEVQNGQLADSAQSTELGTTQQSSASVAGLASQTNKLKQSNKRTKKGK